MTTVTTPPVNTVKLLSRQEVAEGTMAFRFERPADWAFKAGQYLDMTLLDPSEMDSEGNVRSFSIASGRVPRWRDWHYAISKHDLPGSRFWQSSTKLARHFLPGAPSQSFREAILSTSRSMRLRREASGIRPQFCRRQTS